MPYDGEVTVQVYRKDLYDAKGLKPADTLDSFVANAAALNDAERSHLGHGAARLRRRRPEHVHLSRRSSASSAATGSRAASSSVNGPEAEAALAWYVDAHDASTRRRRRRNWNWPDIADAFSQGTVASYIDAHSSASVINNPEKSKVIGKIAYARWPKGPTGKRVTSIWNWGFPINAALSDKKKKATWLFIQWAACAETQARTAQTFAGPTKRSGVNRTSLWKRPGLRQADERLRRQFRRGRAASRCSSDTDVDWRPRVPQWPAIGDTMATAIQSALVGQTKSKEALDEAQARIEQMMRG